MSNIYKTLSLNGTPDAVKQVVDLILAALISEDLGDLDVTEQKDLDYINALGNLAKELKRLEEGLNNEQI